MIVVIAAHAQGRLGKSTYELVSAARQLQSGLPIALLLLGEKLDRIAAEAALLADQVLVADSPSLATYSPELWSQAAAYVAAEGEARMVLVAANRAGREFSPRLAVRLNAPLFEDVIALGLEGDTVTAQRYSFLARVLETFHTGAATVVASVKPGAFPVAAPLAAPGEQFELDVETTPGRVQIADRRVQTASRVSLAEADIVVAGGRGVGSSEGFDSLVLPLAEELNAAVGATRAVVDAGWRPYAEQVGQTGQTVQPKIYVAVGISGATQHLSGMNKSKVVVAINKDKDAPIFQNADYGIVGDIAEIVPALLEQLRH